MYIVLFSVVHIRLVMLMKKGQYFNTFIFQLPMTVKPLWTGDGGSGVISLGVKITRQSLSFHHTAQYLPSPSEHTTHHITQRTQ